MAIIGTFGSFTAARMGIYASQSALNVTGNNIANINTNGYTRQRLDLVSLHSWGTARYANKMNMDVGYGVLTNGVSQLRDPFIDIRYRDEQANVGKSETWLDCLNQLSHTLDEVGDGDDFGILERQFNDFASQLQQLNGAVGTVEYDTTVRSSAEVLCNLLNSYAKALEKVESTQIKNLKDDVTSVNSILTQIRDLNTEIREAGIHGAKALELRDERNVLIDELSKYMKIDVSYDMEKIDEFNSVERLNINIADSGNPPIRLICGTYGTQLGMPERAPMRNPDYDPNVKPVDPNNPTADEIKKIYKYVETVDTDGNPLTYTNNPVTMEQAKAEAESKGLTFDEAAERKKAQDAGKPWAIEVDNAKENSTDEQFNRFWMNVQPLVNSKGRVFRDADGNKSEMVELDENLLYGSLQSKREFLLGEGEFSSERELKYDKDATTTRGVPYYRKSLDALALKFANMFNEANQVDFDKVKDYYKFDDVKKAFVDALGNEIQLDGKAIDTTIFDDITAKLKAIDDDPDLTDAQKEQEKQKIKLENKDDIDKAYKQLEQLRQNGQLNPEYAYYNGGVMFSSNGDTNDPSGITAKNITIAKAWSTGEVRILNTKKPDTLIPDPNDPTGENKVLSHTTADDNIAHMINLMSAKLDYMPKDSVPDAAGTKRYFNGSFQERFADMNVVLSVDSQTTTTLYNSYSIKSLSLDNDRQSVSGVDLNDEATNMMMFQKSYSAACQLMSTLDSMLERLINGTL